MGRLIRLMIGSMNNSRLLQSIQESFIGRDTVYPLAGGGSSPRRYLDSAATTLMMQPAFRVAQDFLTHYASTHSDLHYAARGASKAYDWAHERVLEFVGAPQDDYIAYFTGSGATAGFNRIAAEFAAKRPERNVVIVSEMEHHSNDLPHRKHSGEVVHIPLMGIAPAYGGLDIDVVRELVEKYGERVNYLAVTGASNVTGALTPIHQLARLAHSVGAYLVIDASQMIAHAPVTMKDRANNDGDIDVLVFSGHKIYAPGSPGAVIAKRELLAEMTPAEVGGGMVDDVYLDKFIPSAILPDREEAGTPNIVGAITLGAVLEVLIKIGMDTIRLKEIKLIDLVWEKLSAIEGVNLYGPAPSVVPRTGTIAFNIQGFDHGLTAAALNDYHNIQIRNGCFCAHPYVREILKPELWALDIDPDAPNSEADVERKRGMARASLGIYTTEADVLALAEAIADLVARKDEILAIYEPEGSNGYRHREFVPDKTALFNPVTSLERALNE